jgi:hypothetical protein
MKRSLIFACLVSIAGLLAFVAVDRFAAPAPAGFVFGAAGPVMIRQSKEPSACTPGNDGTLFMNARAEICICDGAAKVWRVANSDKSCTWKTAP